MPTLWEGRTARNYKKNEKAKKLKCFYNMFMIDNINKMNAEERKVYMKEWRKKNKEYLKEYQKKYIEEHKEDILEKNREYQKKYNEKKHQIWREKVNKIKDLKLNKDCNVCGKTENICFPCIELYIKNF